MSYQSLIPRPRVPLILASSWCALAIPLTLPAEEAGPAPEFSVRTEEEVGIRDVVSQLAPPEIPPALSAPLLPPAPARSQNVTVNLINRLVQKGILAEDEAQELIRQAEEDAMIARQEAAAVAQTVVVQSLPELGGGYDLSLEPLIATDMEEDVRVTYIPESVKAQLRDEIKREVMSQAREESWAAPRLFPEWTSRIKLFGDVRVRGEGVYFDAGNDNTGAFPNFNAINTGPPFDVAGTQFSPQLNVDQDRERIRLRARFGLEADLGEGFSAGIRIATGESNSPTSTNQSLGAAGSGQGGNFSKYAIWLDRGFLKYEWGGQPSRNLALLAGRFDNPFFSSEVMWDEDVGFDGVGLQARYEVLRGFTPFVAGGAFPVFNTDFNFASNQPAKFESNDKWLYAGQVGADWKVHKKVNFKAGVAYYDFQDVEGKLSDPFVPLSPQDAGNTDSSRPLFAQKGNTYRPIRNIIPTVDNDFGTSRQFQYYGLATPYRNLAITGRLDLNFFEPVQVSLSGEYIKNLDFDGDAINQFAVNNRGPLSPTGTLGRFEGGDTAWIVGLKVGKAALEKRGDWSLGVNYRYVESDAVIDGFTDSDFGGGGTNLEGFSVGGTVALSPRFWFGLRWMSANEIAGPPLRNDTVQFEFNGKF